MVVAVAVRTAGKGCNGAVVAGWVSNAVELTVAERSDLAERSGVVVEAVNPLPRASHLGRHYYENGFDLNLVAVVVVVVDDNNNKKKEHSNKFDSAAVAAATVVEL